MNKPRPEHVQSRDLPVQAQVSNSGTLDRLSLGKLRALIRLALAAMTCAVFVQVWQFEFVNLDDGVYVFENRRVLDGLSWDNIRWACSWDAALLTGNWHPLTWLSLMLDSQLYGRSHAGGYHLTNMLIHAASVMVLFSWLLRMTADHWKSAFVTALFAIHPMHVESVAWIAERKDVLSTLFGLVSLWAYGQYARASVRGTRGGWYTIAFSSFLLSLLSKQMLVTLPFVFLLLDYWPIKRVLGASGSLSGGTDHLPPDRSPKPRGPCCVPRSCRRLVLEKLPFFALSALFCLATLAGQQQAGAIAPLTRFGIGLRVSNAVVVYVIYVLKYFWPQNLGCFYPYPESIAPAHVVGSATLLLLITVVTTVQMRARPYLIVGWLWYLGTLVPVIGLVKAGLPRMADRFTYFPSIGLLIGVTWLVSDLLSSHVKRRSWIPRLSATCIVLVFLAAAWRQTGHWQNSVTLFEHTLSVTAPNELVHYNLAETYYRQGKPDSAIYHYKRALEIDPANVGTRNNLGNVLADRQRFDEAIIHFQNVLELDPTNIPARNNLGIVRHLLGELDAAAALFQEALEIEPTNAQAHLNLGNLLANQRRFQEAIPHFRQALELDPLLHQARDNLRRAQAE